MSADGRIRPGPGSPPAIVDPTPTKHLLRRAGDGDHDALAQLFARCEPRLRRLLALRAGPGVLRGNDLDDLVQEALLEATRSFGSFVDRGSGSFFRWLAQVALHRLQNLRRVADAQKRRGNELPIEPLGSTLLPGRADPAAIGPGPRTQTAGREGVDRIERAMARLSDVDREVIALSRVEGLSLAEVGERMGRSRNAVALLLSRALRKLRALLDADGAG